MSENPFEWLRELVYAPIASCRACGHVYFPVRTDLHECSTYPVEVFERLADYVAQNHRYWEK